MITKQIENKASTSKSKLSEYFKLHKKLIIAEIIGLIFCFSMSFVFHFAFDWLGKPPAIAFLFATNESVWEHSKIIFYPFLIYSIFEYIIIKPDAKEFLTAKSIPLLYSIPTMIAIFYTYSGIIGTNYLAIDIIMTIAIITAMFIASYKMQVKNYANANYAFFSIFVGIIIILLIIFTYFPPHIALFYDKTKGAYGLQ